MTELERFNRFYNGFHDSNGSLIYAAELLERSARTWPNNIALICQNERITYQDLYNQATAFSERLEADGIKNGDKIIILCDNSIAFFIAYYGIWQTGAIVIPLNTFLHEHELAHVFNDSQPQALFISKKYSTKISDATKSSIKIYSEDDLAHLEHKNNNYSIKRRGPDELAALLYTSGTTGLPKGVMLSSRNILTNTAQAAANFNVTEGGEIIFGVLPLFHSYSQNSCLWTGIMGGATIIIVPKIDRRALKEALQHNPTVVLGIPVLYGLYCHLRDISFPRVKYFICGGDALPDKIRMGFELIFKRKLCNGYGLTETSPFISLNTEDATLPTNTIGKPVSGISIELRNNNNQPVKQGDIGVLWVKGNNVMLGYYNAPEATAHVLQNNWLNTGDLAVMDTCGRLIICGREKDLIVNKGIKIYPQEIENIIMSHALITAVGVVGMDYHGDQIPVAFVATKEKLASISDTLIAELEQLCKNNLAPYKVPRRFFVEQELPMTATGKIDKKILREKLSHNTK
ncbi:MAG: AMP-binding protein [Candidatus Babeliaceae bacterium]|jgi:long-chain acyl-CoA synthetase